MTNWGFALWVAAIACLVLWSAIEDRKRAKDMLALANRLGLKSWADQLPPELTLSGTPVANATTKWNVFEGVQNGIPVIMFDCRMGSGKGSWRRTVIAARSGRDVFATIPSDSSYTVDYSGEWVIFYMPKRGFKFWGSLMRINELEARLSTLGS